MLEFYILDAPAIARVKVGVSGSAKHRMRQIKNASPIKLELRLAYLRQLDDLHARDLEWRMLRHFKS